jgi:transposase/uncharacterized damage-inducible protein DinB
MAAPALILREGDREEVSRLTRSSSVRAGLAQRARIVLLAADGESNAAIAVLPGVSRATVIGWRDRYLARGVAGLDDEPRSGRPRTIDHAAIITATLRPPPKNYGVTHWSTRLLARHLGISDAPVAKAWREYCVQPQRPESNANREAHLNAGHQRAWASRTNMERMSDQPARWSRATIYPDMWADPDDDPRNSDGVSPDGELATLQDFLTNYRMTLRMKCEGLDAEQLARRSVPPSTLSLLGLLRHLAEVERDWRNWISDGDPLPKLYGDGDADFDGAVAEQAEVDAAYSALEREQAATDAALAEHPDLSERLGKDGIAVRELMVHRIEEYARHCGHADLLRECIDGRVGQ